MKELQNMSISELIQELPDDRRCLDKGVKNEFLVKIRMRYSDNNFNSECDAFDLSLKFGEALCSALNIPICDDEPCYPLGGSDAD